MGPPMRIKVAANELVDAEVNMVSLVKHGASRIPFRIVKSEDGEACEPKSGKKVKKALSKMFGIGEESVKVVGLFLKEDKGTDDLIKSLSDIFKMDAPEIDSGVRIFKQEGFEEAQQLTLFSITPNLGVALSGEIDGISGSDGEIPTLPGYSGSVQDMVQEVVKSLEEGKTADALSRIDTFRKHVEILSTVLPASIAKIEFESLRGAFGPSNLNSQSVEGADMSKKTTELTEVAKGDIELGTEQKPEDKKDEKTVEATAKEGEVQKTSTEEKKEEKTVVAEEKKEEAKVDANAELLKSIKEMVTAAVTEAVKPVEEKLAKAQEENEALKQQVKKAEDAAADATKKATAPIVKSAGADVDFALSSMGGGGSSVRNGRVVNFQKAQYAEDVWAGTLPGIEGFRRG